MSEKELKFLKYFNKLTIEGIIYSDNVLENIEENDIEELTKDINLECIKEILEEMSYGHYPKQIIENVGVLIKYLKENTTNKQIEEINNEYEKIKEIKTDEKLYLYESFTKVIDSTYLPYLDYVTVDEESIKSSIRFDSYVMNTLINEEIEILNTELYIYSIRKFLIEIPEIFEDKTINKRALQILEKNKNIKGAERLIYKIKHIDKFINNNFNIVDYKELYDYIVVQNMLNDNALLNKFNEKINEDILTTLFSIIDNDLIKDEKNKRNAIEILAIYKDNIYENKKEELKEYLKIHNKYLSILNRKTEYNDDIIYSECITRIKGIDTLKYALKPLDIDNLIKKDLQLMNLYMFDEVKYEEKKNQIDHEDIYLSINKFLFLAPFIFDDEVIYKRTIDLLDYKNKETKKTKKKVKRIYEGR